MFAKTLSQAALLAGCVISAVDAATSVPTISAVGSKFFSSNGTQFFIKGKISAGEKSQCTLLTFCAGIAYQLTEADPLIDTEQCQRDASLMQTLGANTIRVYHVDPRGSHDGCMSAFASAGIYALIDLDTFNTAINPVSYSYEPWQISY